MHACITYVQFISYIAIATLLFLQDSERKHLKAVSGCNGDQSARLELYEDYRCASKEGSFIQYVLFADVEYVSHMEMRHKEVITIRMQKGNKTFSFYADSQQSTLKWYRYCSLLFKIPNYGIPEIPKEDFALQLPGINHYCGLHKCDTGMCVYTCMYMCACVCACICMCVLLCIRNYIYTYIYYICIRIIRVYSYKEKIL